MIYEEIEAMSTLTDRKASHYSSYSDHRIEALKSLATLLLSEVESLKHTPNFNSVGKELENIDLSTEVERFEIDIIRYALVRANGCQRAAAAILGTKATTLNSKIKRYGAENFKLLGKI